MARYSHKGHDMMRYDITQNITIRYDTRYIYTIRSESASLYVRTASKQATAHNTGAPSFCLSTLSPLQVPGYWPSGEATVVGDGRGRPARRRSAGGRCSLKSRVIHKGYCEYWLPNNSSCGGSPQLLLFGGRTAGGRSHGSNI